MNCLDHHLMADRSIIRPTNKNVDVINDFVMNKHRSFDSVETDVHLYPTAYLNSLSPSGMPPHKMGLKVGCPVMLLHNLDLSTYLPIYMTMSLNVEAVVVVGAYQGNRMYIPRIPIRPSEKSFALIMTRRQFPIRPCFAITSNKAEGQTLDKVSIYIYIYINSHFFSHSQY